MLVTGIVVGTACFGFGFLCGVWWESTPKEQYEEGEDGQG